MSCEEPIDVYECAECGCRFEAGIADRGPHGEERCPQCLMYRTRPIDAVRANDFVVRRTTRFR